MTRHMRAVGQGWIVAALVGCGPGAPGDTTGDVSSEPLETGSEPTTAATSPTSTDTPTTSATTATATATSSMTGDESTSDATGGDDTTTGEPPALCTPGPSPSRRLTTQQYLNTLADLLPGVTLPPLDLPPNGRIEGFENIAEANIDDNQVVAQFNEAADAVANAALQQGGPWLPCATDGGPDPKACGHAFLPDFVMRVFRRPLTDAELESLLGGFDTMLEDSGFAVAMRFALMTRLASDEFLHLREAGGTPVEGQPGVVQLSGFELAARMSYFLWDTMPDAQLFTAAAEGQLDTLDGVDAQITVMQADPHAAAGLTRFARQWLYLHALEDDASFPDNLPPELRAPLRLDVDRFIEAVVHEGDGTLADLLTSPVAFVTPATAALYEVAPPDDVMQVDLDPARRPGLFTRAGWLALRSSGSLHSPFQRGWKLEDSLLCFQIPPPPPGVDTQLGELPPDATTRQLYDTILAEPVCTGCHEPVHSVGYGFENYDLLGKWQDQENGQMVDASGEVVGTFGMDIGGPFVGAAELAERLAGSRSVHDCVARKTLMYALGRMLAEVDECTLTQLQDAFFTGGGGIEALQRAIVLGDGFRHRFAP